MSAGEGERGRLESCLLSFCDDDVIAMLSSFYRDDIMILW